MNELGGYAFVDLRVGMCATFAKTLTEADIVLFAAESQQAVSYRLKRVLC
jgi:3-hydroxybutyryl-CoA dehydratase